MTVCTSPSCNAGKNSEIACPVASLKSNSVRSNKCHHKNNFILKSVHKKRDKNSKIDFENLSKMDK